MRAGDELGGHILTGHVDGVARILAIERDAACLRLSLEAPERLAPLIAGKGSVALDGVSLTVNAVENSRFTIAIIPHTLTHTAFGDKKPGDGVNLEVDLFARYVARLMEKRR
jgi:riboflavin synthase